LIKEAQRKEKEAYQAQKITFDQEWLATTLKVVGNKLHAMLKSSTGFNRMGHKTPYLQIQHVVNLETREKRRTRKIKIKIIYISYPY
jgi:alanine racemase